MLTPKNHLQSSSVRKNNLSMKQSKTFFLKHDYMFIKNLIFILKFVCWTIDQLTNQCTAL